MYVCIYTPVLLPCPYVRLLSWSSVWTETSKFMHCRPHRCSWSTVIDPLSQLNNSPPSWIKASLVRPCYRTESDSSYYCVLLRSLNGGVQSRGVPPSHPTLDHLSIETYGDLKVPHGLRNPQIFGHHCFIWHPRAIFFRQQFCCGLFCRPRGAFGQTGTAKQRPPLQR